MMDMSTHYAMDTHLKAKLQQPYVEEILNGLSAFNDAESSELAVNTYQSIQAMGT